MWFFGESKKERRQKQITRIAHVGILMITGLYVFKYIPMKIWGSNILSDASFHIIVTFFLLYVVWFFIDQNKKWHVPFFVISGIIVAVVAFDRIAVTAHNGAGLLLGILISLISILWVERKQLKQTFDF
ncbi:MAG: hypothetical protein COV34_00575 [Candidatus Zambryskibacteria bacterium CG10_big_fil_rev_8_21_14_0_10_42_12]|uniref:Phosphatidic acid phosphatase type 2/haloperoxidase domain-containing protein n=1 Tax=Candidatus Zambryskibacteria bacterium CG10_big_fil_rev_8_21_14_0_10_42_12 TaxID=1975115 RepID=A0A2H0QX16_9BACT|nr:MAG: hypothetical protein COV34_00575 [Candidatus Zambryskibacteria bacterium CG10_big_fil_rev_8_21_14_0_10_42_12]